MCICNRLHCAMLHPKRKIEWRGKLGSHSRSVTQFNTLNPTGWVAIGNQILTGRFSDDSLSFLKAQTGSGQHELFFKSSFIQRASVVSL